MMKTKLTFYMIIITGTLITISSENWLSMWMGMEVNMMSFVPLINLSPSKSSAEASMIYFLTQSISSIIMLSIIMLIMMSYKNHIMFMILTMSIMIKLGSAPFHMWIPKIMNVMSWNNNIIFMTWQKISPLYLLNMIEWNYLMNISIILSVMLGSYGGLYQTSMRKIMAYSSISHLGWIMSLNKLKDCWVIYLTIYSLMVIIMCNYLMNSDLLYINQMFNVNMSNSQKMNIVIMMMSLGGMPPMLGFLPKWMVIEELMNNKSFVMIMFMVMMSMLTLFFYMRMTIKLMMFQTMINKWDKYNMEYSMIMFIMNLMLPISVTMY
uniref:NADH dehydrogenase subunit 2 n=1 Tax=Tessaromerus quadriarticulatus TaxID=3020145 RepID=UPI00241115A0|nr:NADH dehydrogenase subunit 2 [Tessaromerus quadriarticulatus]WEM32413.1 NADH dehydrogenase subunit 2 [Tessaromerus quadriarticulatus]